MSSAQARSESSSQAPRAPRADSEAPKSGIRVSPNVRVNAKGGTLGGLGPASVGVPRPTARATEDADTYVDGGTSKLPLPSGQVAEGAIPEAPVSRPGRAAVRPRPTRAGATASAVRLAPAQPEAAASPAVAPAAKKLTVPPPSGVKLEKAVQPEAPAPAAAPAANAAAPGEAVAPAPAEEIPAATPSGTYRSLTTTAQDWPVAKVPPESQPSVRLPTFGNPPPGAPNPTRFSMPAFLPPKELAQGQVAIHEQGAANDAMDLAFESALVVDLPLQAPVSVRVKTWAESLPRPVVLAIGVALGVAGMWLAR